MTQAELKTQAQAKIEQLRKRALLLDDIEDACENSGQVGILEIVRQQQDELTILRRALRIAYENVCV